MKFKILDTEFEIDFLDADEMERIEHIVDETNRRNAAEDYKGMTQSQAIRKQCGIIFYCMDGILGEGASGRIFGGRTNLKQALLAFEQLMLAKNQCTDEIREIRDKYSPNRAQRRAAQNAPKTVQFQGQKNKHTNHSKGKGKKN